MVLHRYPIKPFIDLRATLRKGWNHEATLTIRPRVWRFILGVLVDTVVHLYRVSFESLKSFGAKPFGCSSRPNVALMMKLDYKMNYNVDQLIMLSMLLETYYILL